MEQGPRSKKQNPQSAPDASSPSFSYRNFPNINLLRLTSSIIAVSSIQKHQKEKLDPQYICTHIYLTNLPTFSEVLLFISFHPSYAHVLGTVETISNNLNMGLPLRELTVQWIKTIIKFVNTWASTGHNGNIWERHLVNMGNQAEAYSRRKDVYIKNLKV